MGLEDDSTELTELTDLDDDQVTEVPGSPELAVQDIIPKSNIQAISRDTYSISSSSPEAERRTIKQNVDTSSRQLMQFQHDDSPRGSTLLPQSPGLTIDSGLVTVSQQPLEFNHPDQQSTVQPPPRIPEQHGKLSISESTERTTEEEKFTVHVEGTPYNLSGGRCAKTLQLTILHLRSLNADLALALEQGKTTDCQARMSLILKDLEDKMRG